MQRRILGGAYATVGEAFAAVERHNNLLPGSIARNAPRMQEWLKSLADPILRVSLRLYVNTALSDFTYSAEGVMHDPLELPAHVFALNCYLWFHSTQTALPSLRKRQFLHGATIWAGLLRILAGRVTVAGVDTSCVTPELVASNLERFLRAIQADLDLTIDDTGGGLLPLVSQPLSTVPAMSRFNVKISTVPEYLPHNKISVVLQEAPRTPSASREP
ncbi:hypothetical protein JCM8115_006300 [Rhodotorula mucilaginosa]